MNFQFFGFMVFMSIVSFAVVFIAYFMVLKIFGRTGRLSRIAQVVIPPLVVIMYDMFVFYVDESNRYFVGSLPLAAVLGLALYAYFFKGGDFAGFASSTPKEAAKALQDEPKKISKKSQRIHEARRKRGRE